MPQTTEQHRAWREKSHGKLKQQEGDWLNAHPLRSAIKHARIRARERGLPFTIKESDLTVPQTCPVLGIPLTKTLTKDHYPSLERVDNSKGYTPENVIVISFKANRAKSNLTIEELARLVEFYRQLPNKENNNGSTN